MTQIHGHCDDRFAGVRDAFEENFTERGELGAAVTVLVDGAPVVDLWGGWADAARTRPWERGTLVNVWSTGKGPTALCAHVLADRGLLDLDAPVADYWPEFAAHGKESVLVRHLLSHRSGVAGPDTPLTLEELYDWETACARLAATAPWWEPGTRSGYHAISYGFLVGEVVRRITGLRPGAFLRQEITGPLGIDFTFGLPESETHRLAELVQERPDRAAQAALLDRMTPVAVASLLNPPTGRAVANTPAWRGAEIPAANGHGTARAVAALYGILAGRGSLDGHRILSEKAAARAGEGQGACRDLVLGDGFRHETEIALGFWLSGANRSYGPDPRALGHDGAGGSCGLADPDAAISLGYVMNRMGSRLADDPRKTALVNAVYAARRGAAAG
ncbi:serine hydrolase domain-containing protein [Streptomyces sindenensis]|uniref:serine hydrolase domain-containing protein n=1 Tax=Streptomyces sindenensis TaxID=67363 RepID=UPI001674EEBD|nr:serine hydrolase domain-containing protein [Streptomyces sindenensis]GGP68394.1 serine hydrolase [Streptomyces sindenensis]